MTDDALRGRDGSEPTSKAIEPARAAPALVPPGKSTLTIVLEVILIGLGVFLGLAGDQWREDAQHRELARSSLQRFRSEVTANRQAVSAVIDYHATARNRLRAYLEADPKTRTRAGVRLQGLQPAAFEKTAWDLALTTQSLAYIDEDVAFALSRVYNSQEQYTGLTRGITQAMYLLPLRESFDAFAAAAETYFNDLVIMEPKLLKMYDELLQLLDRELAQ